LEIYRGQVKGPCYLSGDDHDRKIGPGKREQTTVNLLCKQDNQTVESSACRGTRGFSPVNHTFLERGVGNEEK